MGVGEAKTIHLVYELRASERASREFKLLFVVKHYESKFFKERKSLEAPPSV